jgi:predicted HicB family RNase H-like nuclease
MNTMNYKKYTARIEYSEAIGCFIGHVIGVRDVIGFHGDCVDEFRTAFHEAVDDYLETCEKIGRKPQKAYSGKLMLRIPSDIHAVIAITAESNGKSINQWVTDILEQSVKRTEVS